VKKVDENQTINTLNQLHDKIMVIFEEVQKWLQLRNSLQAFLSQLIDAMKGFLTYYQFNNTIPDIEDDKLIEIADLLRAIELALHQLRIKQGNISNQFIMSQNIMCNYEFIILDMRTILESYDLMIKQSATATTSASAAASSSSNVPTFSIATNDVQEVRTLIKSVTNYVNKIHAKLANQVKAAKGAKRGTSVKGDGENQNGKSSSAVTSNTINPIKLNFQLDDSISVNYTVMKCIPSHTTAATTTESTTTAATINTKESQSKPIGNKLDSVGNEVCWLFKANAQSQFHGSSVASLPSNTSNDPTMIMKLTEPSSLHALVISGCQYSVDVYMAEGAGSDGMNGNSTSMTSIAQPETHSLPATARIIASPATVPSSSPVTQLQSLTLPCGLSWQACDGSIDHTATMLSDIMSWTVLLKKNPPEKFLKRPPVRFLFDLFQHLYQLFPSYLPIEIGAMDWETVGASKESKSEFMQVMIDFVAKETESGEERITNANAIITGADPELTNKLLQQLALCIYLFKTNAQQSPKQQQQASSALSSTVFLPISNSITQLDANQTEEGKPPVLTTLTCTSWIDSFSLAYSTDGQTWQDVNPAMMEYKTGITSPSGTHRIVLDEAFTEKSIQYVKITPIRWHHSHDRQQCGFQIHLEGIDPTYREAWNRLPILLIDDQILPSFFKDFQDILAKTLSVIHKVMELEKAERVRKQDEMKKVRFVFIYTVRVLLMLLML